jgi:T-complex protein 1 subunit zeta
MKMLVSGAGDIKLTKDGGVLLKEMQLVHPSAMMIARTATAQDDETGDGTTSCVLLIGEILRQAERYLQEGVHPRVLVDGLEIAREKLISFLDKSKKVVDFEKDREMLLNTARTSLCTKVFPEIVDHMSEIVVDAVKTIKASGEIDLYMVEVMTMQHRTQMETRLVNGLVLDHGGRHPDMPRSIRNCYVLILNVSLEYEKSEVNSSFYYSSAVDREKLIRAERSVTDERVRKIIELKRRVCEDGKSGFVIINQKGIDPLSLDMLAKEGILGLRRAKRRNMERLTLACGGFAVSTVDDLEPDCLGFAGHVHQQTLGDDKYTFVEDVKNPKSCTILIKGPNTYTISQLKDAIRDGLRAVKNALETGAVVLGGGSFEVAASMYLQEVALGVQGRAKRGVETMAEALLIVPKTLAENCGVDREDALIAMQDAHREGVPVGLDGYTGEIMDPEACGILDGFLVKMQLVATAPSIASQLLVVDEIIRAGRGTAAH